jgi:hypothetical protein
MIDILALVGVIFGGISALGLCIVFNSTCSTHLRLCWGLVDFQEDNQIDNQINFHEEQKTT